MNYHKIDKIVAKYLKPNFGSYMERRDYFKIEKGNPINFKGYGQKNGLMYLIDVNDDYYLDFKIKPKTNDKTEVNGEVMIDFRKNDSSIMRKYYTFQTINEVEIRYFISLVIEFIDMYTKWNGKVKEFTNGKLSADFKRIDYVETVLK